jgi:parvulin-like peptidyl-prolyl isomerase
VDKFKLWSSKLEKGYGKMRYLFAVILIAVPVIYIGCSKTPKQTDDARFHDTRPVLQVGDHTLTLGEVQKHYAAVKFESAQKEYDAKKGYVDQFLSRFLLLEGAKEAGFTAEIDSAAVSQSRLKELYNKEIMSQVHVTDRDISDFFKKYGGEIEAAQIVVDDSLLADSLYQVLKNGGDFEKLARDYSTDKWHAPNGGNLGYISYNPSSDKIMDIAFGLKVGEFSRPIHGGSSWFIIKVYDHIKNTGEDLQNDKNKYANLASQYQQKKVITDFADRLRSRYHYKVIEPTVQMLIQKADSIKAVGSGAAKPSYPATLDTSCFTEAQRRMSIVEFDGGGYSVDDYLNALRRATQERPPDPGDAAALNDFLQRATIGPMLDLMAREEKIDQGSDFQSGLEYQRDNALIQKITGKIYQTMGEISEADARKYYEEHPDKFYMPDQIRASAIAVKTKAEAQDLLQRARNGANFFMLARKYSLDRTSAYEGGDIGFFTVARYTPIYQAGENLKKGEFGGPVEYDGNWWIFKVTDRIVKYLKGFDLAKNNVYSQVSAEWRIKAMDDFIEKMKEKTHYTMDLDLIRNNLFMGPLAQTGKETE